MKSGLYFIAALLAAFLAMVLLVEVLAQITWHLSGAGDVPLADLKNIASPDRNPTEAKGIHSVAEWPRQRGRNFHEAPMLQKRVEAGELPPVADRLPENPLVIAPPEQLGPYGGTWARFGDSPGDIGVVEARIAYEGLVRWGPRGQKILPNLAVRWNISDGGKT